MINCFDVLKLKRFRSLRIKLNFMKFDAPSGDQHQFTDQGDIVYHSILQKEGSTQPPGYARMELLANAGTKPRHRA